MLASVVIPTYNREKTIQRAVDSVLAQTYQPIEVIVVDDGSTDGSLALLQGYGGRIRVLSQKNQGPGAARNTGIRAATGEVVGFLDSDDVWLPEKLSRQIHLLNQVDKLGIQCCVCNARMIQANGAETMAFAIADLFPVTPEGIWKNPLEILLTRFLLFNQTVLVRRELLNEVGCFDEKHRLLEDYELAIRLAMTGPWAYVAEPLVIWWGGAANSLSNNASEQQAILRAEEILAGLQDSPRWPVRLPKILVDRRRNLLRKHLRIQHFCQHAPAWLGKCARLYLRLLKWFFYRRPSCPTMDTKEI